MKNRLQITITVAAILLLVIGCKKEGPPGPAGADGNANVKSSTITFSNWTWNSTGLYDESSFTWGEITTDIVNSGGVFVYVSNGAGGWLPLPRTVFPTTSYTQSQRYFYYNGGFTIVVQDSDLTPPVNLGTWTIKVLAVASSLRHANPNLDWNNYEAVKARFDLKE